VAALIGEVFAGANAGRYLIQSRSELTARFQMNGEAIEALMEEIASSTKETAALFELNIGPRKSYQSILDEANQALIQMTLQTEQRAQQMERENLALQEQATTDPLTGLANRLRFNVFFQEQFQRAFALQRPLSILFIDVDHFKECNDRWGHTAGDEVLKRVARLLKHAVRSIDLAARHGGEEFALVLTETDSNQAARQAEEIRRRLAEEKIVWEGKVIAVSCSIGVAGTDRARVFQTAGQLFSAADRAVYAAKQAGRNCVRIFRPRVEPVGDAACECGLHT
jgi:diguanylate cyclase (GGDEF)-like protein